MTGWILALLFWVMGLAVVSSPHLVFNKLERQKSKSAEHAKEAKNIDRVESMFFLIETKVLDTIPWWVISLFSIIIGLVLFAIGFVSLVFGINF
ncbi:hypothetical protein [Pseudalkalibacillus caeni]|uniref:Uncharacterized protein n=1 Tax=Exobacillus caeni TaxID=2574798 RepID=A0A5R9FAL4_9BACL|nr:hypothetical protein [Pseudalkalibacillus caeni]TLS37913.1 hypothetical protein FCL54_08840 [Pseudalkalibacillus caeni]